MLIGGFQKKTSSVKDNNIYFIEKDKRVGDRNKERQRHRETETEAEGDRD